MSISESKPEIKNIEWEDYPERPIYRLKFPMGTVWVMKEIDDIDSNDSEIISYVTSVEPIGFKFPKGVDIKEAKKMAIGSAILSMENFIEALKEYDRINYSDEG